MSALTTPTFGNAEVYRHTAQPSVNLLCCQRCCENSKHRYSVYALSLPMVETWYLLFRLFVVIDDRTT